MQFGRSYEEFEVGAIYKHWPGKTITESDVRSSGVKAGLTDIKVASFSSTHTALKFVIPKSKR